MPCAQGSQAAFYVEPGSSPHTFDASSERYEFIYERLIKQPFIISTEGIRGTRQESKEQTREGAYIVGGPVIMNVNPLALDLWLPRILGGSESTDTFPFAESLPSFGVLLNRVTQTFEYKDCYVNSAMIYGAGTPGSTSQLLRMATDIWGMSQVTGTSAPAVSISTTATSADPYRFSECVFTINSTAREVKNFRLTINNFLERRFVNSQTATAICPRALAVTLDLVVPYDSGNSNLYDAMATGLSGTLAITNSTVSTTFTFGTLEAVTPSPHVRGKTEIDMHIRAVARKSGSTDAVSVVNDSTV